MRMRKKPNLVPRMERCAPVLQQEPETLRGAWRSLKPDARELRVEVGCGKGKFTVETALSEPDVLFVAIEKVPEAMVVAMERAMEAGTQNLWFISADVDKIREIFEDGEVDLLYINFCDPWPRSKNAKRRLTYRSFLQKYAHILRIGGQIHFKTDNLKLFEFSLEEFEVCGMPLTEVTRDLHENGPVGIMTSYEEKFYNMGTKINRCVATVLTRPPEEEEHEHQNPDCG